MFVLGVKDINSSRAISTISRFEEDLSSDIYGLARFGNDTYYTGDSCYSPSGDEALEVSPSWPQMSCWNSVSQSYLSNATKALNILDWYKHRTAAGYMVTGEAVSDVSEKPCVSTASEPVTAAAYVLACLVRVGAVDMRIIPDQSNAGCYKALTISSGCSGDWPQYSNVPYYLDSKNDSSDSDTSVKKVYIANDGTNLYLRIDNESGTLPGFNDSNKLFQVALYCEDHNNTDLTKTTSINGSNLKRNMAYCFKRESDSSDFQKYTVSGGTWTFNKNLYSGQMEWEPSSGKLEMKIPLSEIGSTTPTQDKWFNAVLIIGKKVSTTWVDMDMFTIHYRVTGQNQAWLYGDFE